MEDERDMVIEVETMVCMQNLGGRQMFRLMRAGISICHQSLSTKHWTDKDSLAKNGTCDVQLP